MISLQRSMHSSQMYTPGPAMSFLTCFCDFPQNEHFNRSESPILAMPVAPLDARGRVLPPGSVVILRRPRGCGGKLRAHLAGRDDLVDDAILDRLGRGQDVVAVCVLRDA